MDEMRSMPDTAAGALAPDTSEASETDAETPTRATETETTETETTETETTETETTSAAVRPSAGCGAGGRPEGGLVTLDAEVIYRFPEGYDGNTPLPLVFAFHANANPNTQFLDATAGTPLGNGFVMAFPKSVGMGWAVGVDGPRLDGVYADLTASYCIDQNRVFAMGHSSGAQFIEQLLCQGETRFSAVAPSAGASTCASWSPIPTLFIHGQNDTERLNSGDADGAKDLAGYLASNSCQPSTLSYDVAGCLRDAVPVNPGCVSYEGCSAPVVRCSHDDPNYGGTNHGWPCFATQAVFDFFTSQL
jgi:polyhydroxybutyrate depolymerase